MQPSPRFNTADPDRTTRPQRRSGLAWLAVIGLCLGISACSGGAGGSGGGSGSGGGTPTAGVLKVTVNDSTGAKVAGATIQATLDTLTAPTRATDATGVALLPTYWPDGTASVTVSRATFLDKTVTAAFVNNGQINEVTVTLDRATSAAGGSLTSRSGVLPAVSGAGQQLTFEVELVVIDGDSLPIENLAAANFVLRPCTPDPASSVGACVRRAGAAADAAYTPATAAPEVVTVVPGQPARPYAAALMLDQSGSILQTDPTGARLFSAKAFLTGLGDADQVLLAAFASGAGAVIPSRPLTLYAPFRDRASAASYFPTLDELASLVGGDTPLYSSIDAARQTLIGDASLPVGQAKAVIVFTDGEDTLCGTPATCAATREQTIQQSIADQVRLFTIGLSSGVDVEALGELANQTGGAFLFAENAQQLIPLYGTVGKLLSLTLPTYRLRWTAQAAGPGAFQPGDKILGRVQVTAGSNLFEVPFIVRVP